MASSIMHLAATEYLTGFVRRPDLLRLGCVLPDAGDQAGHFRLRLDDNRKIHELPRFRALYADRLLSDDFCLGYYLHLVQDMLYRKMIYREYGWNPKLPGAADRLYRDYSLLNFPLMERHSLTLPRFVPELSGHPLLPPDAEDFLCRMQDWCVPTAGEIYFLTEERAEDFIRRAAELCRCELEALHKGASCIDPMEYAC
jgi:hypothetical protein